MFKSIFNTRVKIIIGILVVVIVLFSAYAALTPHVVKINPANNASNVPMDTTITISFNTPVNARSAKVTFDPPIEYTNVDAQDPKDLILKPNFALTEGTQYTVSVTNPASFSSTFTTVKLPADQVQGQNYLYRQGTATADKQIESQQPGWDKIIAMRKTLPYQDANFLIRYDIANDAYLVTFKNSNTSVAKTDFLSWLKNQGLDENSITIVYVNSTTSNFYILSNDFTASQVGQNNPVTIIFSEPVDTSHFQITLSPAVLAGYDWDIEQKKLTISPLDPWGFNKSYIITVGDSSLSKSGEKLDKDYSLGFKTEPYGGL